MPGKHVRFSPTNLLYQSSSTVPSSLSHSHSALKSCIRAPPPEFLPVPFSNRSVPYAPLHKALSFHRHANPIRLNSVVAFSHKPAITYDISLHPSYAMARHGHTHTLLAGPATTPPVRSLTIISPHLPWSILVRAPGMNAFVSVSDVITTIHQTLRKHVSEHEYNTLLSPSTRKRVKAAYEHRYQHAHDHRASSQEQKGGVRRVDFLMGRNRFLGLSPSADGPHTWTLNVT